MVLGKFNVLFVVLLRARPGCVSTPAFSLQQAPSLSHYCSIAEPPRASPSEPPPRVPLLSSGGEQSKLSPPPRVPVFVLGWRAKLAFLSEPTPVEVAPDDTPSSAQPPSFPRQSYSTSPPLPYLPIYTSPPASYPQSKIATPP